MNGERCPRCAAAIEPGDLRCAVCALVLAAPAPPAAGPDRPRSLLLRCDRCAAAVGYDVAVRAPRCAFCGTTAHVEEAADPPELAEQYLPCTVSADDARAGLRRWLAGLGWFRPTGLAREAAIGELAVTWWPAWVFSATAQVSWCADVDARGRSGWAPIASQEPMEFTGIPVPASRGLSDREARALLRSYDLSTPAPATPPPGATVEPFEIQRSSARGRVLDEARAIARTRVAAARLKKRGWRNLHVELLLRDLATRRLALPAYIVAYRHRGKIFRAVVAGQNSQVIGEAPLSRAKIAATIAAALAGFAMLALLAWWWSR
jgi:hypothetical protein